MLFVPRRENQYRPYLTRRQGLLAIMIAVLGLPAALGQVQTGSVLGVRDQVTAAELVVETNRARGERHLPELAVNKKLTRAAASKAQDMFKHDYWSHVSPSGVEPWHWFEVHKYEYSAAGENLAKNFGSSQGVMSAWLASPEHRANIMNKKYQEIGIAVRDGILDGKKTQLIVAMYGKPLDSGAAVSGASVTIPTVLAASDSPRSLTERVKAGFYSLTPGAKFAIAVLLIAVIVAVLAHASRRKLPLSLQKTWYKNHGIYKVIGLVSIILVVLALYGGGQI